MERDPTRWKDDPELDGAIRDDLARVAEMRAPIDVSAGLSRLEAAIGKDGGGTGGAGGLGAAGPWIAGAFIAVAISGAIWWALRDDEPARERPEASRPPPAIVVAPPAAPEPIAAAPIEEVAREEPLPEPPRARTRRNARPETREPEQVVLPRAPAFTLQEEMEHIARTRRTLSRDPALALALAEEGQRRFPPPNGVYREEREGIAVLALVELGRRDEARARGERYLALYPNGADAARVRRALAAP